MMKSMESELEASERERYMALSPQERIKIGAQMFDDYRREIVASFPPGLPHKEVRRRLFEHLYGPAANWPGLTFLDTPLEL